MEIKLRPNNIWPKQNTFKSLDFNIQCNLLIQHSWDQIYNTRDLDIALVIFLDKINIAVDFAVKAKIKNRTKKEAHEYPMK